MLETLCLKDKYWREIAFKICKDRMLADDLVSEMYLKLKDCKKEINDFYVIGTIQSIFIDEIRKNKTVSIENFYSFSSPEKFEADDKELEILQNIYWVARDYIELNQTMSLRDMGKALHTNHRYIHGIIKKEKLKWQKEAKDLEIQLKKL